MDSTNRFQSKWHFLPDMVWTGADCWAQRLQDWKIQNGQLICRAKGPDRSIHLLTHQLSGNDTAFRAELVFRFLSESSSAGEGEQYAGFRLGVKGRFEDYRSAIFTGKGIDAGLTREGFLFIGTKKSDRKLDEKQITSYVRMVLSVRPLSAGGNSAQLTALDQAGNTLAIFRQAGYDSETWRGNIAVVSHCPPARQDHGDNEVLAVEHLLLEGDNLEFHPGRAYGPVYFAQYSLNNRILKMTAQLAPVDISGVKTKLQVRKGRNWTTVADSEAHPLARTVRFRLENWNAALGHDYRLIYRLPLRNGKFREYTYEGSIAAEPVNKEKVRVLAFSCNWDLGFPDNEVVEHAAKQDADMVFFLGDQFYEPNGGFGIQTAPLDKAVLDYLRKWYQFGWSYRELFRHRPMAALPDDHDMYHGNIWGAGGRATIARGTAAQRQDSGGYKMPAEWVNMAQLTQTSHMPDPYDPRPVLQGISVYYNIWDYAGISFGIIEDRKFKSPPKEILPPEADVFNGYSQHPQYDSSKVKEMEAHLLGERQLQFLSHWVGREKKEISFRVLVSATPFCCLQTLPAGTRNDQITPDLPIPAKGEYIAGDVPTRDMDSNGWPHNRRDEVLEILGKGVHLHLAGDQHLPAVVQYGDRAFRDSIHCFAVPALCNIWPRRWWPEPGDDHQPIPGHPKYTGDFKDGFGNRITVYAVANPVRNGRLPALLYDRPTGYGVVELNKANKKITLHCWPRYADPANPDSGQFPGWPFSFEV